MVQITGTSLGRTRITEVYINQMNKKMKFSLLLMLIIISILVACGGNKSFEERLMGGGVWLSQRESSFSYLIVFTPEGNVLYGRDFHITFEITDSTLTMSSSEGDYVEEYAISDSADGNTIFLTPDGFVDGSGNTIIQITTLTHHSEYKPTSLSSLNLENSFWVGPREGYTDIQSNSEVAKHFVFTSNDAGYVFVPEENKNWPTIEIYYDFMVLKDEVQITLDDELWILSVSVFNEDTIIFSSGDYQFFVLQRMNPDMVEKMDFQLRP